MLPRYVWLSVFLALVSTCVSAQGVSRLRLAFPEPHLGRADVEILFPDAPAGTTSFRFAEVLPGRRLRDNPAAYVTDLAADDGTSPLPCVRKTLQDIVVTRTTPGPIRLRYRRTVSAGSEVTFDVRPDGAALFGAAVFPNLSMMSGPVTLEIATPAAWRSLCSERVSAKDTWRVAAGADVAGLRLCAGTVESWQGEDQDTGLIVSADRALGSRGRELVGRMAKITSEATKALGTAPVRWVELRVVPTGPPRPEAQVVGSTLALRVQGRIDDPGTVTTAFQELARALVRRRLPGLAAPEGWNVPAEGGDPASSLTWLVEGASDWLGTLVAIRAGELPESAATELLASRLDIDGRSPPRSAAADSAAAFDRERRPPPILVPDPAIRGTCLVAQLDLQIRQASRGVRGIEDALRALLASPERQGFSDRQLFRAVESVAPGLPETLWWTRHVEGTEPVHLQPTLAAFGWNLVEVGNESHASLGVVLKGTTVTSLQPDSPLKLAGASEGDTLVGIGTSILGDQGAETLEGILARHRPGDIVTVTWRRADGTVAQKPIRAVAPKAGLRILALESAPPAALALRAAVIRPGERP